MPLRPASDFWRLTICEDVPNAFDAGRFEEDMAVKDAEEIFGDGAVDSDVVWARSPRRGAAKKEACAKAASANSGPASRHESFNVQTVNTLVPVDDPRLSDSYSRRTAKSPSQRT